MNGKEVEQKSKTIVPDVFAQRVQRVIAEEGFRIDEKTSPYASFDGGGLFFIQKGFDSEANPVVFKIAKQKSEAEFALKKEARVLSILSDVVTHERRAGKTIATQFLQKLTEIHKDGIHGMVTVFIPNDDERHAHFTSQERFRILRKTAEDLHALPVPSELLKAKEWKKEGAILVMSGNAHKKRTAVLLETIKRAGLLTTYEREDIMSWFEQSMDLFASFRPVFTHGDLHGENIAFHRDGQKELVTLMDFELLRIDNEFRDWAIMANTAVMGSLVSSQADQLKDMVKQLRYQWIDEQSASIEDLIEKEVIFLHFRGEDAKLLYYLMRIKHALEMIVGSLRKKSRVGFLKQAAGIKILRTLKDKG